MIRPLAKTIIAIVCVQTGALMGCAEQVPESPVDAVLRNEIRNAETIELLSLDPMPLSMTQSDDAQPIDEYHGYEILGLATIDDPSDRESFLNRLFGALREPDQTEAACFNPRHGIRAVNDDRTIEFLICFECDKVYLYEDGSRTPGAFDVDENAADAFNAILRKHNVPLPNH